MKMMVDLQCCQLDIEKGTINYSGPKMAIKQWPWATTGTMVSNLNCF
jgi:hypothetical protein